VKRALLLHGFSRTPASWERVARDLPLPIDAPVLAGHGDEPPREFASEVERLRSRLVGETLVAGYSLGGRLALALALATPGRVPAAVIVGGHPGLEDDGDRAARARFDDEWAARLERSSIDEFVTAWETLPVFADVSERVRAQQREERTSHEPERLAAAMRGLGLGRMPSLWEALASSPTRFVFVAGERDAKFRALAERAAQVAPRARLHVVAGAGHDVLLEAPDALAAILRDAAAGLGEEHVS